MFWLKNRIIDAYLNWKHGKVVFTKEEVENMRAMFDCLTPSYKEGDRVLFQIHNRNYEGTIVAINYLSGKRFVVNTDSVSFGVYESFIVSEEQIIERVEE